MCRFRARVCCRVRGRRAGWLWARLAERTDPRPGLGVALHARSLLAAFTIRQIEVEVSRNRLAITASGRALVEDAASDQGVPLGDPAAPGGLRTLQPAHRTRHHAVASAGPPADLGEAETLSVQLADPFALGLGDVEGVDGAAHGSER
jgi:hypothetical protein